MSSFNSEEEGGGEVFKSNPKSKFFKEFLIWKGMRFSNPKSKFSMRTLKSENSPAVQVRKFQKVL